MQCKNHPAVAAADRCSGCAEPFCIDCLVEIQGQKYCGACKVMALKGRPLVVEQSTTGTVPCKEARDALSLAILSLFCFGFILGPLAIAKASNAKALIAADPELSGSGKATAAQIIGGLALAFWLISLVSKVSSFR